MRFGFWFIGLMALLASSYYSWEAGYFEYLWKVDNSKLSFINLFIVFASYSKLGYEIATKGSNLKSRDLDPGYEAAGTTMDLGLLGTVIGFILMSTALQGVDFSKIENIKEMLTIATSGMAVALYTTGSGIVSYLFLRLTHYFTDRSIKE